MRGFVQKVKDELPKRQDLGLLFLRVGVGIILVAHGTTKLADPVGTAAQFADLALARDDVGSQLGFQVVIAGAGHSG